MLETIKERIPANVRKFLLRAAVLIIGWELIYNFWLKPLGIPDNQLTQVVQFGGAKLLSLFYNDISTEGNAILIEGRKVVRIAHQCNGLELIILYLGFILCIPTNIKRMLAFSIVGTAIIYILNVIRTAILAVMYDYQHSMTDFAHHYLFKIIIYAVVFAGWVLYVKKPKSHVAES